MKIRLALWITGRAIVVDEFIHRHHWPSPAWICLTADVGYGWGYDASDFAERANLLQRWLATQLDKLVEEDS